MYYAEKQNVVSVGFVIRCNMPCLHYSYISILLHDFRAFDTVRWVSGRVSSLKNMLHTFNANL